MTNNFCYAEFVKDDLVPKLKTGIESGELTLTAEECQKILFLLRTSVHLEPFLESFMDMVHSTFAEWKKEQDDEPKR